MGDAYWVCGRILDCAMLGTSKQRKSNRHESSVLILVAILGIFLLSLADGLRLRCQLSPIEANITRLAVRLLRVWQL